MLSFGTIQVLFFEKDSLKLMLKRKLIIDYAPYGLLKNETTIIPVLLNMQVTCTAVMNISYISPLKTFFGNCQFPDFTVESVE